MKDLVDEIIQREGGETNDPADSGGRTKFGISERAHPAAWADGDVSYEEAREIYSREYLGPFKRISNPHLRNQLADFGVTAGQKAAVRLLQRVVGVEEDGQLGPVTLRAVETFPSGTLYGFPIPSSVHLNLQVERARAAFYVRLAQKRPKDLKFLFGWLKRALSWR